MKIFFVLFFFASFSYADDLPAITENVFKFNNLGLVSKGIVACEKQKTPNDYLAFCNAFPLLENKEVLKFSNVGHSVSTEKIELGDFSIYTGQDHTRHYLSFNTSQGEVPSALLSLASSVTVISKDHISKTLGYSPLLSFFEKDNGLPLGMALVDVDSHFGEIRNKIIYTTNGEKNIIGFDFFNILGNFSITKNSFSLEGDEIDCNEGCSKIPLDYESGKFYLDADVGGKEYQLLLDTSSEISSIPNEIKNKSCFNDFDVKENIDYYDHEVIKGKDISLCNLDTKIGELPVFKSYYLTALKVERGRGVLGMNFFNSFDKIVFDIKKDYLYLIR